MSLEEANYIHKLAVEVVRQKEIYRKALDLIDKYGGLIDMQATARKAIAEVDETNKKDIK